MNQPFRLKQLQQQTSRLRSVSNNNISTSSGFYSIPLKYRKMENLHIVFWLLKDISWCLVWRPLGLAMIVPTLSIAIVIAWRTRHIVSELCHNLAIAVWIIANSYWMISEFFQFDTKMVVGNVDYKHLALIPFGLGVLILSYYYIFWKPKHAEQLETM
jgi:hypothetical protein